jgi:hypothetical protein
LSLPKVSSQFIPELAEVRLIVFAVLQNPACRMVV